MRRAVTATRSLRTIDEVPRGRAFGILSADGFTGGYMAQNKTVATKASVSAFIAGIEDEQKRKDCRALMKMMREATGNRARLWGPSIVGFGSYDYTYASGRSGTFFLVGFSPRKQNLSVYVMPGFSGYAPLLKKLGPHKTGKSCLYIKSLDDVDRDVLRTLIEKSVAHMKKKYGVA